MAPTNAATAKHPIRVPTVAFTCTMTHLLRTRVSRLIAPARHRINVVTRTHVSALLNDSQIRQIFNGDGQSSALSALRIRVGWLGLD
jgi:hypothetical protein